MITIKRIAAADTLVAKTKEISALIVAYLSERDKAAAGPLPIVAKPKKDPELAKLVAKYGDEKLGLKQHLMAETAGKCAYCESKITHVDYGDIEHIVPKSVRPDLAVDLTNLTIACGICNTNKSDYYNAKAPLVDPHVDECCAEIVFIGWGIVRALCGARGQYTLRELDLNRGALNKRREDHFNKLGELFASWRKEPDPEMRYALLLTIWEHAEPDAEYTSMCLTALEDFKVERLGQ